MNNAVIRILLVEDDEDDYLITHDLLGEIEHIHFVVEWATTPDEARTRMASAQFDICLLDYRLGRHNGLELIGAFREQGFRAPIILLTGQNDYDTDRKAMAAGASDYLVKGQIDAPSLERTIRYAIDQKNSESQLRQQTQFVSAVLDTAGALVVVLDRIGRIVRFNRACEEMTGYAASEVTNHFLWDKVLSPAEGGRVRTLFPTLRPEFFPNEIEACWQTRDGRQRLIAWSDTALLDSENELEYIVCTGIDVTEQREAEAALFAAREREIEVGASIQRTLLVRRPPEAIHGAEIGSHSIPSQKIGGDYFDFFVYTPDEFDVLVGDVMGKGVPAALLAAAAKSHFQRAVRRLCLALAPFGRLPEPQEVLAAVQGDLTNELMGLESYITLVYARFDLRRQSLRIVECGHPHPLCLRSQADHCEVLEGDNLPLGMSSNEIYRQTEVPIRTGDVFFFYSDGLSEASDTSDNFFGDGLAEAVCARRDLSPQALCEDMCRAVQEYSDVTMQPDDLTCVAVRVSGETIPAPLLANTLETESDVERLEDLRDFLELFFLRAALHDIRPDEEWKSLFILAVNEAVTNSMKHAYCGQTDHRVQIEIRLFPAHILLCLYDWGTPFVRTDIREPDFDGSRDNGFGLFIIEEAMDAVKYDRDDLGRNRLTLCKNL